ncbi:MAG TPA: response regulator [Acidobacteriota bacterium]|nr:response regulator [Acidobacteriota bacterium]
MRVFVADGSAMFCRRLERMLSELKKTEILGSVQDPTEAVREIGRLRPDVLLLDIHLFSGKGLEILKRVRRERWALFVLIFSDDVSRQYRDRCVRAGADYVLYKPEAQDKAREILTELLNLLDSAGKEGLT